MLGQRAADVPNGWFEELFRVHGSLLPSLYSTFHVRWTYWSRHGLTRRPVMLPLGPRLFTKVPERS